MSTTKNIPTKNNYHYWIWSKGESNIEKTIRNELAQFTRMKENKKEQCLNSLLNRDLIKNNKSNPFMVNNNYLDDINNQEKFQKPQNSNYEKVSKKQY